MKVLKIVLKHAGGPVVAALLAGLGLPVLAALVLLAVLVLAAACWVISSADRSDRVTRMILARRGDASCLAPAAPSLTACDIGTGPVP